jgi:transcriptional regulator with GAF, ATPase, and Fis domain
VDVRVIAATNQDLWRVVRERTFRADFCDRLNVFPITLPPLRERHDDIPLLAAHFVQKFAERQRKSISRIHENVMEVLKNHQWPANTRELQNFIERAVIMTSGTALCPPIAQPPRKGAATLAPRTLAKCHAGAHSGSSGCDKLGHWREQWRSRETWLAQDYFDREDEEIRSFARNNAAGIRRRSSTGARAG